MEDDLTRAVRVHYFDRTPDRNTPFQPEPVRARRVRTYRDSTGEQAIGNITKEQKR